MIFMVQRSYVGGIFNGSWKYVLKGDGFENLGDFKKKWTFLGLLGLLGL